MLFNTFRAVYLTFYLVIASQGLFYLLGIYKALGHISLEAFAEQRNAIDEVIAIPLKVLYYGGLSIGMFTLIFYWKKYDSFAYVAMVLAFVLMIVDVALAVTQSVPINQQFHSFSSNDTITDWAQLRADWLYFVCLRGGIAIAGLLILLISWISPSFVKG